MHRFSSSFAACVVLYKPSSEVVGNILTYGSAFEKVFIMDNTPGGADCSELTSLLGGVAELIQLPANPGIAAALKIACELAIKDGFRFLLTMDQDSSFPVDLDFEAIEASVDRVDSSDYGQFYLPHWQSSKTEEETWYWSCSAGTFINLTLYKKLKGFDEGLVVDLADFDVGFQFYQLGKPTLVLNRFYINHSIGYGKKSIKIFGRVYSCRVYPPFRYYYIIRNDLVLKRRYPRLFQPLSGRDEAIAAIACLRPRWKYLKAIICGYIDGKRNKLGKYHPHQRQDKHECDARMK